MAAFEAAYDKILETFKLNSLRSIQREALEKLVSGEDVFVIQPTGSGKSLIFQTAPIVFVKFQSMAVVISLMLPCERSVYIDSGSSRIFEIYWGHRRIIRAELFRIIVFKIYTLTLLDIFICLAFVK